VPKLQDLWSEIERSGSSPPRLVEPFVGGMAIALGLQPQVAMLNDANKHVINFYRCLQQGLTNSLSMVNDAELYLQHRSTFNQLTVDIEQTQALRAGLGLEETSSQTQALHAGLGLEETSSQTQALHAGLGLEETSSQTQALHAGLGLEETSSQTQALLFYYLNRTGFNGLCRFNNKGEFNVPFGRYKTITYSSDFLEYQDLLGRWEFSCGDFAELPLRDDDFIYADPPYDRVFTKYSQQDFTWDDQERLAEWLANHAGQVVVSNQATDRIMALYEKLGFRVETLEAPRRIACNGNRKPALEMLAYRGF
jgi:site-specific DNA-adenine methylase